ncbi:hypothetical protein Tco_0859860 [Tanacetum coccineum]|uniref:Uncharacterized protein n=1 Tax=Tanacetum coccineum TaxID=301880 RepID=A0ABQ5BE55_9ASTR
MLASSHYRNVSKQTTQNRYITAKTDISLKGGRPPRYRRAIFTTLPVSTASLHEGLSLSYPTNPEEDDSEIPPLEDIYQNSTDAGGPHSRCTQDDIIESEVCDRIHVQAAAPTIIIGVLQACLSRSLSSKSKYTAEADSIEIQTTGKRSRESSSKIVCRVAHALDPFMTAVDLSAHELACKLEWRYLSTSHSYLGNMYSLRRSIKSARDAFGS